MENQVVDNTKKMKMSNLTIGKIVILVIILAISILAIYRIVFVGAPQIRRQEAEGLPACQPEGERGVCRWYAMKDNEDRFIVHVNFSPPVQNEPGNEPIDQVECPVDFQKGPVRSDFECYQYVFKYEEGTEYTCRIELEYDVDLDPDPDKVDYEICWVDQDSCLLEEPTPTQIPSVPPTDSPLFTPSVVPTDILPFTPTLHPSITPTSTPVPTPTPTLEPGVTPSITPTPSITTTSPTPSPTGPVISPTPTPTIAPFCPLFEVQTICR